MTKEQALDVVRMAAKKWAQELEEYIIPEAGEADLPGYEAQLYAISEALDVVEDLELLLP